MIECVLTRVIYKMALIVLHYTEVTVKTCMLVLEDGLELSDMGLTWPGAFRRLLSMDPAMVDRTRHLVYTANSSLKSDFVNNDNIKSRNKNAIYH